MKFYRHFLRDIQKFLGTDFWEGTVQLAGDDNINFPLSTDHITSSLPVQERRPQDDQVVTAWNGDESQEPNHTVTGAFVATDYLSNINPVDSSSPRLQYLFEYMDDLVPLIRLNPDLKRLQYLPSRTEGPHRPFVFLVDELFLCRGLERLVLSGVQFTGDYLPSLLSTNKTITVLNLLLREYNLNGSDSNNWKENGLTSLAVSEVLHQNIPEWISIFRGLLWTSPNLSWLQVGIDSPETSALVSHMLHTRLRKVKSLFIVNMGGIMTMTDPDTATLIRCCPPLQELYLLCVQFETRSVLQLLQSFHATTLTSITLRACQSNIDELGHLFLSHCRNLIEFSADRFSVYLSSHRLEALNWACLNLKVLRIAFGATSVESCSWIYQQLAKLNHLQYITLAVDRIPTVLKDLKLLVDAWSKLKVFDASFDRSSLIEEISEWAVMSWPEALVEVRCLSWFYEDIQD